jgi:hypothetical protein
VYFVNLVTSTGRDRDLLASRAKPPSPLWDWAKLLDPVRDDACYAEEYAPNRWGLGAALLHTKHSSILPGEETGPELMPHRVPMRHHVWRLRLVLALRRHANDVVLRITHRDDLLHV